MDSQNRLVRALAFLLVFTLVTASCRSDSGPTPVAPVEGMPAAVGDSRWWNNTVFYEIFVRSFYDSDGDGTGDFAGIIEKLDYLNDGNPRTENDLGVTGIWLMPIFPSASYHGYDVTDYYAVNPEYGTMDGFKRLLQEAHARGIRVIIDLVLNHTSSQHPWFQSALQGPDSEYRNWYVWADENPRYLGPWGQQVWHAADTGFYYGVFWDGMPDLNYTNPEVVEEMKNVSRFWLEEVGVDGFRLDAARHIVEEGQNQSSTKATHAFWADYRQYVKSINPEALILGEVWTTNFEVKSYTGGDQLDLVFNFDMAEALISSAYGGRAGTASEAIRKSQYTFPPGMYATFLTNHDQNRVVSVVENDIGKAKAAASLLLTSPGVPFIYYGEEIGMRGEKPDEMIRRPMQWSADGGFTSDEPWQAMDENYPSVNVELQDSDPESLLAHYRRLVHLRNRYAALRIGDFDIVRSNSYWVYASLRTYESESILVIINLGKEPISDYSLSIDESSLRGELTLYPLLGEAEVPTIEAGEDGGFDGYIPVETLSPYGTYIFLFSQNN